MEDSSDLKITEFVNVFYRLLLGPELAGKGDAPSSVIKVNNEDLAKRGEFSFMRNLEAWRKAFRNNPASTISSRNDILENYLLRNGIHDFGDEKEVAEKAFENMTQESINSCLKIDKFGLRNERVSIFIKRNETLADCLARIVARGSSYGVSESGVAKNIFHANGYRVSESPAFDTESYDIATKSRTSSLKNEPLNNLLLCGVAKSSQTGTKETAVTEAQYFDAKLAELANTTEHKLPANEEWNKDQNSILGQITEAAIALEFLSVKPSRTLTIASGLDSDRSKGSSFILYNTARISAIFQKFDYECSKGNYPVLPDIRDVDFSLLNEEEEWELFYNFLLGYPEMVKSCIRLDNDLEICPQYICSFLSHLCSKFSAYYRRVRILTEGRDHLLPTMMARLYLLKAVQIVTCNALRLLNIDPVSRM